LRPVSPLNDVVATVVTLIAAIGAMGADLAIAETKMEERPTMAKAKLSIPGFSIGTKWQPLAQSSRS
jgi:hypothetical protein